jgi:mannose-6-phosphate isomerase-like protein (cupin superfamily)
MKIVNIKNIKTTLAHGEIKRKALVRVGELKSKVQTVNYAWLEPNESFSPHKHDDCEELYFFLEGKGKMIINDKIFEVKKNDFIVVEVGEWHSLNNTYSKKLIFLTVRIII